MQYELKDQQRMTAFQDRQRQEESRLQQRLELEEKDLYERRQKLLGDIEASKIRESAMNREGELVEQCDTYANSFFHSFFSEYFLDQWFLFNNQYVLSEKNICSPIE